MYFYDAYPPVSVMDQIRFARAERKLRRVLTGIAIATLVLTIVAFY